MRPYLALSEARQAQVKAQDGLGTGSGVDIGPKDETGNEGESEVSETAEIGSNSNAQLRSIVDRIETLEEEKQEKVSDIKDVYAEAKGNGYDVKALRTIIRMRKQDAGDRAEQEAVLETYMHALGMI